MPWFFSTFIENIIALGKEDGEDDREKLPLLNDFIGSNPQSILLVTHEVKVRHKAGVSSASARRLKSTDVLKKPVNVIDVACRFMTCYDGLKCCDYPLGLQRTTGYLIGLIYAGKYFKVP